jgi:hypothetical protein
VNGVDDLRTYLCRRDRTAKVLDMNVFQLSLELAMPEKFPLRKALALKLACAAKRHLAPADIGAFVRKPPAVKTMKEELGLLPSKAAAPTIVPTPPKVAKRKRLVSGKRRVHPAANSKIAKAHRTAVRKRRRAVTTEE